MDAMKELRQIVADINPKLDRDSLDPDVALTQQGMDSLDVFDYVLAVEERFGTRIDNDDYDTKELGKIGNMASYISDRPI